RATIDGAHGQLVCAVETRNLSAPDDTRARRERAHAEQRDGKRRCTAQHGAGERARVEPGAGGDLDGRLVEVRERRAVLHYDRHATPALSVRRSDLELRRAHQVLAEVRRNRLRGEEIRAEASLQLALCI